MDSILPGLRVGGQANIAAGNTSTVLTDWVTISGDDGEDGNGTSFLLGPVQPAAGATDCTGLTAAQWEEAAAQEFTYSIDGSVRGGNGRHWLSSTHTWRPGCYGWQHHSDLNPSGATADSSPVITGETTLLVQPEPTTSMNTSSATVGSYLTGDISLAGTYGRPVQITGQLLQAGPNRNGQMSTCTGAPGQWDSPTAVATIGPYTVIGDGDHPVPGRFQATTAGCYSFAYHLTATIDSSTAASATVSPGTAGETALIDTPTISTTVPETISPASAIPNTVTITGLHLPPGDTAVLRSWYLGNEPVLPAGPTGPNPCLPGTIRDQLPTVGQPDAAGCTSTGWEETAIVDTLPAMSIAGDGTYHSQPIITPARPGYGTFVQALTYNGVTALITAPGALSSVVQATAPTITTVATAASSAPADATAGTATLSDTLTVTGLHLQPGDSARVTAHVFSAQPTADGCADVDWANAQEEGSATVIPLPADGQYNTEPIVVQTGCHTFTEALTINGNRVTTDAEKPGQNSETLFISSVPPGNSSPPPSTTPPATSSPPPSTTPPATSSPPPSTASGQRHVISSPAGTLSDPVAQVPAEGGNRLLATTGTPIQAVGGLALLLLLIGAACWVLSTYVRPRQ